MKCLLILLVVLLASCSAEWRLQRLLRNNPELLRVDTVNLRDTAFIKGSKLDTVFSFKSERDTIVLKNERVLTKVIRNRDSVYVFTSVSADTIIREIRVPVERVVKESEGWWRWWYWVLIIVLGLILATIWGRKK